MKKLNEEKAYEVIASALSEMYTEDIVPLWNLCCDECNMPDDYIHENDESTINELFYSSPWDLLMALGEYSIDDDYFCFDGYACINSFNYIDDENSPFDIDVLAQWLVDNSQYWEDIGVDENDCMDEDDEE